MKSWIRKNLNVINEITKTFFVEKFPNWITQNLICISQQANAVLGGDADEMLCSRCYRTDSPWMIFWDCVFFWWVPGDSRGHCQWCYDEEKRRLVERFKEFER